MSVNSVASSAAAYTPSVNTNSQTQAQTTETANTNTQTASNTDKYIKSEEKAVSKSKSKPDTKQLQAMINESNKQTEAFKKMIEKLLMKQASKYNEASSPNKNDLMVEIDDETRKWAQEAISEDGYYGVKKTSERILGFAFAYAGDDPVKLEKMKKAVELGFGAAAEAWGAKMPDITQQTYDAVMKGFDEKFAAIQNSQSQ